MTSHFQGFFIYFIYFFRPPDPRSEKNIPVNQLIKKILALKAQARLHRCVGWPEASRLA